MGRGKREQVRDGGEAQATGATSDEDSDHGSARCVRGGGVFFRRVSGGCVGLLRVLLFVGKGARVVERGVNAGGENYSDGIWALKALGACIRGSNGVGWEIRILKEGFTFLKQVVLCVCHVLLTEQKLANLDSL